MIKTGKASTVFFLLISLILLVLHFWPDAGAADDHKSRESRQNRFAGGAESYDDKGHERHQVEKKDDGNEVTGQTAAWLLVAANLTVALSILVKGANRFFALAPEAQGAIKRFNQRQKKHLMRFHYVFNPLALGVALFHFLLSSCRTSALPEGGLIVVALMVSLGFMVKFRVAPRWMQRFVYRLHTGLAPVAIMIVLLVAGHLIMD